MPRPSQVVGVITRKDLLPEVSQPDSCTFRNFDAASTFSKTLFSSTYAHGCLLCIQVLEERDSLDEILSSRGRLGPEA